MNDDAGRQPDGRRVLVTIGDLVEERYPVDVSIIDAHGVISGTRQGGFLRTALPDLPAIAVDGASRITLDKAGLALFTLLAAAGLDQVWDANAPVPLVFDVRAQELCAVPWELLRARNGGYPFRDPATRAVRARWPWLLPQPPDPTASVGVPPPPPYAAVPVNVLVIVGDPLDPVLSADDEIEGIYQGLRGSPCCWQVEVLRAPRMEDLYEAYPDIVPDVVHVIGHGIHTAEGPAVQIMPPGEEPWALTADFITGAMLPQRAPRLAVLNACRTADEPNKAVLLARSLTDALLDGGTAAVVAMQGDVASPPAARFAEKLYERLAAFDPIDQAVATARAAVHFTAGFTPRDWVLPVLELTASPDAVLSLPRRIDPATVIRQHNGFRDVVHIVDRIPQRRQVQRRTRTAPRRNAEADSLLFVTGPPKSGRSALIRSCVVTQVVRGDAVIYHSLEGLGHVSAADFVLGVVGAAQRWLGDWATPQCAETATALRAMLGLPMPDGHAGPAPDPAALPPQLSLNTPARPNAPFAPVDDAYKSLQALLVNLARTQPLVVVLDHVGRVDERDAFVRGLLAPAAETGGLPGVQVVVVEGSVALEDLTGEHSDLLLSPDRQITVPNFGTRDAVALVREYLARIRPDDPDPQKWKKLRGSMISWAQGKAAPAENKDLEPDHILGAAIFFSQEAELDLMPGMP